MLVLKRKVGISGCEETESSDPENKVSRPPPPKRQHKPFTLPRESGTPSSRVQPPIPKTPKALSVITPAVAIPPTPWSAAAIKEKTRAKETTTNDGASSSPPSPIVSTRKISIRQNEESSDDEPTRPVNITARNRVRAERNLNDLHSCLEKLQSEVNTRISTLEDHQVQSEKQHTLTHKKLDEILGLLRSLNLNTNSVHSSSNAVVHAPDNKTRLITLNRKADPDLYEVCRAIDRKGALSLSHLKHASSVKTLARRATTSALGIPDLKRAPTFYSKNGLPDFFPEEYRVGEYCPPSPHWTLSFAENYPWVPTVVDRFRSMIPNDGSSYAAEASSLSDDEIISLICHGPFKTLKARWNTTKTNSPDDPDVKDAGKRGVSHIEAKCFKRRGYRSEIKGMLESKWDAGFMKGVMSPEVSDGEGGTVVHRPQWRAGWYNSTITSIDNAERAVKLAKPGKHTRVRRTIEYVEGPPPSTLRSPDGQTVKIPLSMISKVWRKAHPEWIESMPHLIDMSLSKKPDTSAFVAAHPAPVEPEDEPEDKEVGDSQLDEMAGLKWMTEYEGIAPHVDADKEIGRGDTGGDKGNGKGKGRAENDDSDSESNGTGEGEDNGIDQRDVPDTNTPAYSLVQPSASGSSRQAPRTPATMQGLADNEANPDVSVLGSEGGNEPHQNLFPSIPPPPFDPRAAPPMPPPPPLSQQNVEPASPRPELKKKRGRPPGAKNKKTIEKERLSKLTTGASGGNEVV